MSKRLLRLREVLQLVPVSKSTWYGGAGKTFPSGRKLTERCTVWDESEVLAVVDGTWREGEVIAEKIAPTTVKPGSEDGWDNEMLNPECLSRKKERGK
ncbi:hypothetical protein GMSM_44200 [Geomonas sp. Red276]